MGRDKVKFIRGEDTLKIKTTAAEKKYRKTHFRDDIIVKKKYVNNCTACGEKNLKEIRTHPVLEVLWCKKCEEYYGSGEFATDEYGRDEYCRWCAEGGKLYCCSNCSVVFCKMCVKRNLPKEAIKNIEKDNDWKCFVCVPRPLWDLRAICEVFKRCSGSDSIESTKSARMTNSNSNTGIRTKSRMFRGRVTKQKTRRNAGSRMETKKDKDQSADISKDNSSESERKKTEREAANPPPHPDEAKRMKIENIFADFVNKSSVLRKSITKKEAAWKKNYFGADVTKLRETVRNWKEDFSNFLSGIRADVSSMEKSFAEKFDALDGEKKFESSPIKENNSGDDDMSLTLVVDDGNIATDANDESVSSLVVNVSSIADSLNTDDENELRNQYNSLIE